MKRFIRTTTVTIVGCSLAGLTVVACSASGGKNGFNGSSAASGSGASGAGGAGTAGGGNGGAVNLAASGSTTGSGLGCKTTVSGTVYDPAGKLPLYDIVVYVPSQPVDPIATGASCETCGSYFSGKPIAAALSDATGKFTMDVSAIPSPKNVPLVIQVGKWRREVTVPSITACADTPIDPSLTRLPRNQSEGSLPQIAMVRGGSDALECLIRKLGVDDAEFTTDSGTGRVHLYYINGGTSTTGTGQLMAGNAALTPSTTLYADLNKMMKYDIIIMACPGSNQTIAKSAVSDFVNVRTYADQGGRVFGSHYNADYINPALTPGNPYPTVVTFTASPFDFPSGFVATGIINTTFPKGKAMSDWLVSVGGSTVPGQIPIQGGIRSVDAVVNANAESWITATDSKSMPGAVEYFAFPTPIGSGTDGGAMACGRMVFSDLHVSSASGDSGKVAFPGGCTSTTLSPQEEALAFMFFDLASCIQPETGTPMLPPTQ
jgi:hypothetical protein